MRIKSIIRRIVYPNTFSSKAYIKYLRKRGCKIGENTHFHDPNNTVIDKSRPEFIEIGTNCQIASGAIILAHDYSYSILNNVYKEMLPTSAVTKIGNNVFIGMNSIILMGSTIGDNVIIGAGAVVKGNIPSGTICAGNPARPISTIDNYYYRLKGNVLNNAKLHAKRIQYIKGRQPNINELGYYSWIFLDKNNENKEKFFDNLPFYGSCKSEALSNYMTLKNKYNSFDDFLSDL